MIYYAVIHQNNKTLKNHDHYNNQIYISKSYTYKKNSETTKTFLLQSPFTHVFRKKLEFLIQWKYMGNE